MANKMDSILTTLLLVVIGLALSPVVGEFAASAVNASTGATATIYGLVTLFWALIVIGVGIAAVRNSMK